MGSGASLVVCTFYIIINIRIWLIYLNILFVVALICIELAVYLATVGWLLRLCYVTVIECRTREIVTDMSLVDHVSK